MEEDGLPISAVEHYAYCPRQAALILVEGVWAENADTALGSVQHHAVDRGARLVRRDGVPTWLSLPVLSASLGVAGVCDSVELRPGPVPVEHKPLRTKHHLAAACQQLAMQAMCLEEMFGEDVPIGVVFAHKEHRRQEIHIDDALRSAAVATVQALQQMLRLSTLPERVGDERCRRCSLRTECMVDAEGHPEGGQGDPYHAAEEAMF